MEGQTTLDKYKTKKQSNRYANKSNKFNLEEMRKKLTRMYIIDELPFRVVEGEGFRRYSHALEPRFVVPSRITIARDCMALYHDEKKKLKKMLKSQ